MNLAMNKQKLLDFFGQHIEISKWMLLDVEKWIAENGDRFSCYIPEDGLEKDSLTLEAPDRLIQWRGKSIKLSRAQWHELTDAPFPQKEDSAKTTMPWGHQDDGSKFGRFRD